MRDCLRIVMLAALVLRQLSKMFRAMRHALQGRRHLSEGQIRTHQHRSIHTIRRRRSIETRDRYARHASGRGDRSMDT
jgi:hypothetical protein